MTGRDAPCDSNSPAVTSTSPRRCAGSSTSKLGTPRAAAERQRRLGAGRADREKHAATCADVTLHARGDHMFCTASATPTSWETSLTPGGRQDRRSRRRRSKGKWQERQASRRAKAASARRRRGDARRVRQPAAGASRRARGADAADHARLAPGVKPMSVDDAAARGRRAAATASSSSATPRRQAISVLYRRAERRPDADRDRSMTDS